MARTITDEEIRLSITINGNTAQKQLSDLEKSTRELTEQKKNLQLELARVERRFGANSTEARDLRANISQLTNTIDNNRATMRELQSQIGLTGLTMAQLTQRANALRLSLRNAIPGSEDYRRYQQELNAVTTRMNELNGRATQTGFSIGRLADGFNRYAALGASVIAGLTGVALSIQKIIDINGKLSDSQADVMKTTGMSKKEVDELTKSFGLLQTRTSRIDLLNIAEQGGRIGIAKDQIGSFVEVMNKANVALGDSFTGGAEEVANKLGKLKFLFQETKDLGVDQAYNAIGSAINDLGANGVASEANIAEFTTRVGSLPDVLKPTIKEALALGAAFEESGIEAEVSSRAYNIFMKQASTESSKFAQVMGVSKESIEQMINTNPLDFMMKFAQGMRGMDATETAKTLDFLGVNADGANKVIGAMGNNMARFKELIDLSNNSFAEGTSLVNEYEIKNATLGATLEKIQKTVAGWFSSETFIKWLTIAVQGFANFIGATEESEKKVSGFRIILAFTVKLLAVLITSMISFSIAAKIASIEVRNLGVATAWANLQSKLNVMWLTLQRTALMAYSFVMTLFGREVASTTLKIRALNVAGAASPWGAIIGVLAAVIGAYIAYRSTLQKTISTQETFALQQKKLNDEVAKENAQTKANITSLIQVIKSESVSLESRKKAYEELIKINPIFNGFLKDEKFNIEGLINVYSQYLKQLDEVTYAKKFSQLNEKNIEKEIKAQQRLFNAERNLVVSRQKWDDFQASKQGKSANSVDWSMNRELALNKDAAEKELKLAKENLLNATKIVDSTNNFRENKIKSLENSIKKEEEAIIKITDKNSQKYKIAFLKLEGDKAKLKALLGTPDVAENVVSNFKAPTGDGTPTKNPNSSQKEIDNLLLQDRSKFNDQLLKLVRQLEDDKVNAMQDGYQKEMAIEELRYKREIEDLERQKIHADEIAKLDEEIAKAKEGKDITKYNALLTIKKKWSTDNAIIDEKLNEIIQEKSKLHFFRMGTIQEKFAKEEIEKAKADFEKEKIRKETAFLEELNQLQLSEEQKKKKKEEFAKQQLIDEEEFLKTLISKLNSIAAKDKIGQVDINLLSQEQVDYFTNEAKKLGLSLQELIDKRNELAGKGSKFDILSGTGTDIFGFSPEQWKEAFNNLETTEGKLKALEMTFSGLQNAWSSVTTFLDAKEENNLKKYERSQDARKNALKRQLDAGFISQTQYSKKVEAIDKEMELKKAELEYKKAKRDRIATLANITMNTAIGITKAVAASPWTAGMPWSAIIGAIGALQIATVLAQPLPARGFEEGLYPDYVKREQDGKVFKSSGSSKMQTGLFSKPTILVGEGPEDMPEMVIDKRAFSQISPETKRALFREIRGIKGFEQGLYNSDIINASGATATAPLDTNNAQNNMVIALMAKNIEFLQELKESGVIAYISKDFREMKKLQEQLDKYNALRDKNKQ